MNVSVQLAEELEGLPTKSAKIRRLSRAGMARADIARYLGLSYQHVRNVLVAEEADRPATDEASAPQFVKLDSAGRLLIPAAMRRALGATPAQTLVMAVEEGALVVRTFDQYRREASAALRAEIGADGSLVDELIADRRAEAARGT